MDCQKLTEEFIIDLNDGIRHLDYTTRVEIFKTLSETLPIACKTQAEWLEVEYAKEIAKEKDEQRSFKQND